MSTSVDLKTVTNSIESLTITGVTIKDCDNFTESVVMSTPLLAPRPEDFITGVFVSRDESSGQKLRLEYVLNYRYYHCPIEGGLGGLFGSYGGFMTKVAAIILAISSDATLTGAIDNTEPTISEVGPVQDPTGNTFLGCVVSLKIMQFLEV